MKYNISNNMKISGLICSILLVFYACGTTKAQQSPKDSKAYPIFGEALKAYQVKDYNLALELIDKCMKKDPLFYDALGLKAAIYDNNKDFKNTELSYQQILAIDPNLKSYNYFFAEFYFRNAYYNEAIKYVTLFIKGPNYSKSFSKDAADQLLIKSQNAKKIKDNPVPFNPINLGPNINTKYNEYFPGVTIDRKFLFITREINGNEDIYWSELDSPGKWKKALNLGPDFNSPMNEGNASPSADGKYIFFTMCNRENGFGSCDIYFSRIENGKWKEPKLLDRPLNSISWETQPCISADGRYLYFASSREGSLGNSDIFRSEWDFEKNKFLNPINLGSKINTKGTEEAPFIHADGKTLYFISNEHPGLGQNDIFFSRLENDTWSTPQNLGYPINSPGNEMGIIVDRDGTLAYYSSERAGGYGGLDIYSFELPKLARPFPSSYVSGTVRDAKTLSFLSASLTLIDLETKKTVLIAKSNIEDGKFLFALAGNKDYLLNVNNQSYLFYSHNFSLKNNTAKNPFLLDILLKQPTSGETVVLQNIFFDTDKFNLKDNSSTELEKLNELLTRFPKLSIEIGGHTDNSGDAISNQKLSENRAKAVQAFLISKGIASNRILVKGYGSAMPIESNNTAEGRALNRRTEFKVISN